MKRTRSIILLLGVLAGYAAGRCNANPPPGSIVLTNSFAGDTRTVPLTLPIGSQGVGPHPDPSCGIGPVDIVSWTRQGITIYDKSGNVIQATMPMSAFFASMGVTGILDSNVTDPRATYDTISGRYYLVEALNGGANAGDYICVSSGTDPTGPWKCTTVFGLYGDLLPVIGYDQNGVYFSENDTSSKIMTHCAAFPRADLLWTGTGTISKAHLVRDFGVPGGPDVGTCNELRDFPATNTTPNQSLSTPEYIITKQGLQNSNTPTPLNLVIRTWTWADANTPQLSGSTIIPTGYMYQGPSPHNSSDSMSQPGSPETMNCWESYKPMGAKIDSNGYLWTALGSVFNFSNYGFYWFKLRVSDLTIVNSGSDVSTSCDRIFPSFDVDNSGNAVVFYMQGSGTQYGSIYAQVMPLGSSTLGTPVLMSSGTHAIDGGNGNQVSVGTYSSSWTDPDGKTLWTYQQIANNPAPTVSSSCVWTTEFSAVQFVGQPPALSITSPSDGTYITTGSITISGTAFSASGLQGVTVSGSTAATSDGFADWNATLTSLVEGTNTISVVATDNSFSQLTTSQSVNVIYATDTFDGNGDGLPDAWQIQYFGPGFASNPQADPTANPSGDGTDNLLKYAFGMDPTVPSVLGLPTVSLLNVGGTNYLAITFHMRLPGTSAVTYTVQTSSDLQTWDGTNAIQVGNAVADANGITQTVTYRDSIGTSPRFIRIKIN